MYNSRTMRPRSAHEYEGSEISGSSRGSSEPVNSIMKPTTMMDGDSSFLSHASSATPSLNSQTGMLKPYQAYHEDDVPFDQQSSYVSELAAPSFDEGTGATLTSDDNTTLPSYQETDLGDSDRNLLGPHEVYDSEFDDSIALNDAVRHREAMNLSGNLDHSNEESFQLADSATNLSLTATQGVVYPNQLYSDTDGGWATPDQSENHYDSFLHDQRASNRVQPPSEYLRSSSFDDLSRTDVSPTQAKPRSILKRHNYYSDSDADESAFASHEGNDRDRNKSRDSEPALRNGGERKSRWDSGIDEGVSRESPRRQSKQAFTRREKTRRKSSSTENENRGVSFNKQNRVHRYEQEEEDNSYYSGYTGASSVTSGYSKSIESEVEDMWRDFFFIGEPRNPGRRRSNNDRRRRSRDRSSDRRRSEEDDDDTLDDSTTLETYEEDLTLNTHDDLNTYDESTFADTRTYDESTFADTRTYDESTYETRTMTIRSSDISDEDPFTSMWNMMQGGVSAVGAALGVTGDGDDVSDDLSDKKERKTKPKPQPVSQPHAMSPPSQPRAVSPPSQPRAVSPPSQPRAMSPPSQPRAVSPSSKPRAVSPSIEKDKGEAMRSLDTTATEDSQNSAFDDMFQMASGFLMGDPIDDDPKILTKAPSTSSEDEEVLAKLALYAAQAKHEASGYEYDESKEVDIVTEIQFSVVNVMLPMGILFQENPGGCWAAKVFPSGNAAQNPIGGTVEAGDQLAAIDGTSAVELKVDKVCSLVSRVPKGGYVELTFVRYTGPMKPKLGEDEGYEVHDPVVEKKSKSRRESVWKKSRKVKVVPPAGQQPPPKQKKKIFRLFGRGKKNF